MFSINSDSFSYWFDRCVSKLDFYNRISEGYFLNGRIRKKIRAYAVEHGYDLDSFNDRFPLEIYYTCVCKRCNNSFHSNSDESQFCSTMCARSYAGAASKGVKRIYSVQPVKKKKQLQCTICNSLHSRKAKTCGGGCQSILQSRASKEAISKVIAEGRHQGWASRSTTSYPERFFMKVLKSNGIAFEREKKVGKYFLDFSIGNFMLDLEIDGKQHLQSERSESDRIRDSYLSSLGWTVHRIPWKYLGTAEGKTYMKSEIDKFLKLYKTFGE